MNDQDSSLSFGSFKTEVKNCEKVLFELSFLTDGKSKDSSKISDLVSTIKFLKTSCTLGNEFQSYLFENDLHLLIDGYCKYFLDKDQLVVEECIKFYVNLTNKYETGQKEIIDRLFLKGNIGILLMSICNYKELVCVLLLNCLKFNSSLLQLFTSSPNFVFLLKGLLMNCSEKMKDNYLEIELFCLFVNYLDLNHFVSLKENGEFDCSCEQIYFLNFLSHTSHKNTSFLILICKYLIENISQFDRNSIEISLLLQLLSCPEVSFDELNFSLLDLKKILQFTFCSDYNSELAYQSNILLILTNLLHSSPQVSNDICKLEFLPLILKCTAISDSDIIRRESAIILIKHLIEKEPEIADKIVQLL